MMANIIGTRKQQKKTKPTFISYIDFSKAYARICQPLLWWKCGHVCIATKFLKALTPLYENVKCCVMINGKLTY